MARKKVKNNRKTDVNSEEINLLTRILMDAKVPYKLAAAEAHKFNKKLDRIGLKAEERIKERDKYIAKVIQGDKKVLKEIYGGKQAAYAERQKSKIQLIKERKQEGKSTGFFKRHLPGSLLAGKTLDKIKAERLKAEDYVATQGEQVFYKNYGTPQALLGKQPMYTENGKRTPITDETTYRALKQKLEAQLKEARANKNKKIGNKKANEIFVQLKNLEKAWTAYNKGQKRSIRFKNFSEKTKNVTFGEKGRTRWLNLAKGTNKWVQDNTGRTLMGLGNLGEGISQSAATSISPIQIFQMAWTRLSTALKFLVVFIIFAAILFVPWGLFYYTGWAIAAAFMFLISAIYVAMISFLNGIGNIIVIVINGIIYVIMRIVILIVETILQFLVRHHMKITPNPTWASKLEGNPFSNADFQSDADTLQTAIKDGTANWENPIVFEYAQAMPSNYWYQGHMFLESSMIAFNELARVPELMFAQAPVWQDWMYDSVLAKFVSLLGLDTIGNIIKDWMAVGVSNSLKSFIEFAPPWLVLLAALLPTIVIVIAVYLIYKKNKMDIISGMTNFRY